MLDWNLFCLERAWLDLSFLGNEGHESVKKAGSTGYYRGTQKEIITQNGHIALIPYQPETEGSRDF